MYHMSGGMSLTDNEGNDEVSQSGGSPHLNDGEQIGACHCTENCPQGRTTLNESGLSSGIAFILEGSG